MTEKQPTSNVNAYVRVPGRGKEKLAKILQTWDDVTATELVTAQDHHFVIVFPAHQDYPATQLKVTRQVFEVALYTLATKRFTEWMKANGGRA